LQKNQQSLLLVSSFLISELIPILAILPVLMPGLGYNIVWAYAFAIIISSLILCVVLPRTMKRIPYFKEFLVRDYDPQKRIK